MGLLTGERRFSSEILRLRVLAFFSKNEFQPKLMLDLLSWCLEHHCCIYTSFRTRCVSLLAMPQGSFVKSSSETTVFSFWLWIVPWKTSGTPATWGTALPHSELESLSITCPPIRGGRGSTKMLASECGVWTGHLGGILNIIGLLGGGHVHVAVNFVISLWSRLALTIQ